jgi:hypothetical protein
VDTAYTVRVEREDHELLVLDGLELVRGFRAGDISAQPGGYDELAGTGDSPDRITEDDIHKVNSLMRARAKVEWWRPALDDDQAWLAAIPRDLDIIELDNNAWQTADGPRLVSEGIASCIRPYLALGRATKVLHFKRPRVFPVLDELAVEAIGVNLPDQPTREQRIAIAKRVVAAVRREGRNNIEELRRIQAVIAADGPILSLVRIFDIVLWFSHTAAGVDGARRELTVRLRD